MQYWKPAGDFFTGDCMPFYHDGVFHLYYLLDQNHHQALNGLGGHQWAHASTTDLVHWQHHPLALAITSPEEGSICTGSVYHHAGTYYAFYATRLPDWRQQLSLATSVDAIHFTKVEPNPFAVPPPGYSPVHFRDPRPFQDPETGLFHMLVSAQQEATTLAGRGGCLAHLVSPNLARWEMQAPMLVPGYTDVPECADYFAWNGWYYLIFSNFLTARYRMARHPLGPWLRPPIDTLDGALARVMKTAEFTGGRRIGVAWLGTRSGDRDDGQPQWGGNLLFRELVQHPDGTLGIRWPADMIPARGSPLTMNFAFATPGVTRGEHTASDGQVAHATPRRPSPLAPRPLHLHAPTGLEAAGVAGIPLNVHIAMDIAPGPDAAAFGLRLRGGAGFTQGYDLAFHLPERMITLHNEAIFGVDGLDRPFHLEIVLKDDIIDVCVDSRRCIVNRCPEQRGEHLYWYAHDAEVTFTNVKVRPIQ